MGLLPVRGSRDETGDVIEYFGFRRAEGFW